MKLEDAVPNRRVRFLNPDRSLSYLKWTYGRVKTTRDRYFVGVVVEGDDHTWSGAEKVRWVPVKQLEVAP